MLELIPNAPPVCTIILPMYPVANAPTVRGMVILLTDAETSRKLQMPLCGHATSAATSVISPMFVPNAINLNNSSNYSNRNNHHLSNNKLSNLLEAELLSSPLLRLKTQTTSLPVDDDDAMKRSSVDA
ncbi:hypothetical protein HanPSC8_Chr01g0013191 [Helianthus annuus]|nr:hypothetical protein HanPSC8_Chr01g0013191 [Helianthus annuus]